MAFPHTGIQAKGILGNGERRREGNKGGMYVAYLPEAVSAEGNIALVPYLKANRATVNTHKHTI